MLSLSVISSGGAAAAEAWVVAVAVVEEVTMDTMHQVETERTPSRFCANAMPEEKSAKSSMTR